MCNTFPAVSQVDTGASQHRIESAAALGTLVSSTASYLTVLLSSPAHASASESLSRHHAQVLWDLADIDARTAGLLARILQPFLSIGILLMIIRIVLSWYPQIPGDKLPWSVVVKPTEPVLGPTRRVIQPVGGVDISPIIWVALLSFINEILLGPQGILNLLQRKIDIS
ncbi:Protein COFACTOR ASSEMBLY OF COMPLEX C SUBUNIT B CCB3, chloroplastic [Coccomyxa sp. Obi]|nr:Protein COFACTOR ASSEMBLY OF COMPLEX C SUBUNIT B CCB3, chloroplastic [Coccomyxa sp. Obi]